MNDDQQDTDDISAPGDGATPPDESHAAAAGRKSAGPSQADMRRLRAAQKLRENLMRRKQQQRSRRSGLADEAEGLPAAAKRLDDG